MKAKIVYELSRTMGRPPLQERSGSFEFELNMNAEDAERILIKVFHRIRKELGRKDER